MVSELLSQTLFAIRIVAVPVLPIFRCKTASREDVLKTIDSS